MEPPSGIRASAWSFFKFLPFFLGLLLLGIIKGEEKTLVVLVHLVWLLLFVCA